MTECFEMAHPMAQTTLHLLSVTVGHVGAVPALATAKTNDRLLQLIVISFFGVLLFCQLFWPFCAMQTDILPFDTLPWITIAFLLAFS